MKKYIIVDEEGYFILQDGIRLNDDNLGKKMLESIKIDKYGVTTLISESEEVIVEAFDKPYVAHQIFNDNHVWKIQLPYQLKKEIVLDSLSLDEWDRFHGDTIDGIPFVFTSKAQAELFNLASEFSDESITFDKQEVHTGDYYIENKNVETSQFWDEHYNQVALPSWELSQPHPELTSILQQLKLNKQRVLVLGCGSGHDAAFFAEKGFVVTAIDMSEKALNKAKEKFSHLKNLEFIHANAFDLSHEHYEAYDLIFEHTCYCAISPTKRSELIKKWHRYLSEEGHILSIFFVVPKRNGPYFGGSEWELREKLQNRFQFLYWTRLKHSPGWRLGAELLVYAKKRVL